MRKLTKEEQEEFERQRAIMIENAQAQASHSFIFTKYQFVNAIRNFDEANNTEFLPFLLNLYSTNPQFQFFWNTVNQLDLDNDDFKQFLQYSEITNEQLEQILEYI